eukprot:CAMPEP_0118966588 /NCGR_PEP_ID=MMETSP1173-20130426/4045_1 /TAXON_ID=1034831 /ORGANISM="Rhizochromulina marina cf, Strain CCMP1243" /LENGTH=535 /DNA_ID=CAMNT_0006915393 /DNA_START=59 /DNA_END=1666 /DNA_ORIENTATION=-
MRQAGLLVAGLLVLLEAHSLCLEGRLRRCCAMSAEAFPKSVKRKCAILTGFHGQKFYGSQMNSDASCPSVESTLFQGLLDAGLVHPSNAVSAKKIGLTSASRVDRGVSAVRFVTIAKLEVSEDAFDEEGRSESLRERINAALDRHDLAVFAVCRVSKKFRPREFCNWRKYEYLIPRTEMANLCVDSFDDALQQFEGTHSFLNFCKAPPVLKRITAGAAGALQSEGEDQDQSDRPPPDAALLQATRSSVYSCRVADSNHVVAGTPCIRVEVVGQSFVYNQIRLMVGAAWAVADGTVSHELVSQALELPERLAHQFRQALFPLAPACGLLLVDAGFDRFPVNSIATDAQRAQDLATPPKYILLSPEAAEDNARWRLRLQEHVVDAWTAPAAAEFSQRFLPNFKVDPAVPAYVASRWAAFRRDDAHKRADRARREEEIRERHAATQSDGPATARTYRSLLPQGFSTAAVAYFRTVPGQRIADLQRGLSLCIQEGQIPHTATTKELLDFASTYGEGELIRRGSEERLSRQGSKKQQQQQ